MARRRRSRGPKGEYRGAYKLKRLIPGQKRKDITGSRRRRKR